MPSRYRSSSTLMLQTCSNTSKGTRNWALKLPLTALWGAYIASFVLKFPNADAFIRRMENKSEVH